MTGPKSATVETLTAAVRVLMVGNRQVTLSVYRQLDVVAPDEIEPFGRVRDSKDEAYGGRLYVVGAHHGGGVLVRSSCPQLMERSDAPYRPDHLDRRALAQERFNEALREYKADTARGYPSLGDFLAELQEEDRAWVNVNIVSNPRHVEWSALPLIVLAGLR